MQRLKTHYRLFPLLSAAVLFAHCSGSNKGSNFSGSSAKSPASDSVAKQAVGSPIPTAENQPSTATGSDAANISADPNKEVALPGSTTPAYNPTCFEVPVALPTTPIAPKEKFNWVSPNEYNQVMHLPVVGPLQGNNSSIAAVAFKGGNYQPNDYVLFVIDGKTGANQWNTYANYRMSPFPPVIGDVDGDGKNEVVATAADRHAYAFNGATGVLKWANSDPSGYLVVADVDSDGKGEVLSGNSVIDGVNGKTKFRVAFNGIMAAADINDSPGMEIVSVGGISSGKDGHELCKFGTSIYYPAIGRLKATDAQMSVVGMSGGKLHAFSAMDCSPRFAPVTFPDGISPVVGGGPVNLADMDGDGELEIGVSAQYFYAVFKQDGRVLWKHPISDASSGGTGSTTFDLNGDGKAEVIYNDEQTLRVFDGTTGRVVYATPNSSGTLNEYPVVADVDGDGKAEIVVAANNYAFGSYSGIRVFGSPDNSWVGARPIWNQHAYLPTLVSDQGGIGGFEPKSVWEKFLPSAHLVGFRNNVPHRPLLKECQ